MQGGTTSGEHSLGECSGREYLEPWVPVQCTCTYILPFLCHNKNNTPPSSLLHRNYTWNCTFPIDLAPNRIPFGAKSIGNVLLQSKFGLDEQDLEKIPLCLDSHFNGLDKSMKNSRKYTHIHSYFEKDTTSYLSYPCLPVLIPAKYFCYLLKIY